MQENYYQIITECGHVGARNSLEVTRYFKDFDIITAYNCAQQMPRSKKKNNSVKSIKLITYEEYLSGKALEENDPYLNTYSN